MESPQLEALLEAANRAGFRRATDALYSSQPSLSARVQTLEDEFGVVLFNRTTRGVWLTNMGRTFYPSAQRQLKPCVAGIRS